MIVRADDVVVLNVIIRYNRISRNATRISPRGTGKKGGGKEKKKIKRESKQKIVAPFNPLPCRLFIVSPDWETRPGGKNQWSDRLLVRFSRPFRILIPFPYIILCENDPLCVCTVANQKFVAGYLCRLWCGDTFNFDEVSIAIADRVYRINQDYRDERDPETTHWQWYSPSI